MTFRIKTNSFETCKVRSHYLVCLYKLGIIMHAIIIQSNSDGFHYLAVT